MEEVDQRMLEIRSRYQELVDKAARSGIDLLNVLDPVGVSCNTGTSCCAGDGKVLDARELLGRPELVELQQPKQGEPQR
jgi:hypothetical protein